MEEARKRGETIFKVPEKEVFPQLSPSALKKIKVPSPEYKGLHSENLEMAALLEKFEKGAN